MKRGPPAAAHIPSSGLLTMPLIRCRQPLCAQLSTDGGDSGLSASTLLDRRRPPRHLHLSVHSGSSPLLPCSGAMDQGLGPFHLERQELFLYPSPEAAAGSNSGSRALAVGSRAALPNAPAAAGAPVGRRHQKWCGRAATRAEAPPPAPPSPRRPHPPPTMHRARARPRLLRLCQDLPTRRSRATFPN
eukprot:274669-Chlamydomonas_euryale.AAC.3